MEEKGTELKGIWNVKAKATNGTKNAREKERAAAIGNVVPHDIPKKRNPCNTGLFASEEEAPMNVILHDILGNHTTFSTESDAENT